MEQLSITRFTQATQPFVGHFKTLQPMKKVPEVKRPVGRPRKRSYDDPETQVQQTQDRAEIGLTSQNDVTSSPKRIRAAYSLTKKKEAVEHALSHSIYQACKHFNLSTGTVCWRCLKAQLFHWNWGGVGEVGHGTTRSTLSHQCRKHHWPSCPDHSTSQSIVPRK